jgi:membrane fusion protein (multidrug efflux system)
LPGQFAKINLILDTYNDAIMIPTQALISELGGTKVWVFDNGTVSSKSVETGIRTEDKIQITSGLTEGDVVITSGLLQIRQGMEVNIQM